MAKIQVFSQATNKQILEAKNRILGTSRPHGPQPTGGDRADRWYWGELLADVGAGGWNGVLGFAKIMVPSPASITAGDDPVHFHELGTGPVSSLAGGTPIVITSVAHGLQTGQQIWIAYLAGGGLLYAVGATTADTFELAGTSGSGTELIGGTWYCALKFTNRDPTLSGSQGSACKVQYGFGEWSLTWVGC